MTVPIALEFPEVWTTRDGRKIAVSDMEEHHVRAALNMVIRRARKRTLRLQIIKDMHDLLSMSAESREMMSKHDISFWDDDNGKAFS